MKRTWILLVVLCPMVAFAQTAPSGTSQSSGNSPPYQPAVPAASVNNSYGGWYGNTGGNTVAGSAMNGMANVISARPSQPVQFGGRHQYDPGPENEIQNRQLAGNTSSRYAPQRQAVAAERGPPPTMEQIATIAKYGCPKPLKSNQFDPVTGKLAWPTLAARQLRVAAHRSRRVL